MGINVGNLEWDAVIRDSEFQAQINRIEGRLNSFNTNVQTSGDKLEGYFKRAAASAAAFFSVQAGTDFIKSLVTTRGEFQQLEIAFSTMLKSKERADSLMKDIVQFAATTPFDLKQVAAGTKQLLAYGFAAEDMQQNLSMLGNVASGVGSQIGDLIYLYGTLKASGRVTQMDINQFAGRGIPVYEELAKVLQINVEQVREFVSAGKIGFSEIEQAFKNMTGTSGMFYNLMQEQSKSLTGQLSNLGDAWESMLNEIGRSQEGVFAKGIEGLATLVENYQTVIDIIKTLIAVYGAYRAALILNTVVTSGATAVETLHYAALVIKDRMVTLLTGKMAGLTAATAGYTAVIAALAAIIYSFVQNQTAAEVAEDSLADARRKGAKAAKDETEKIADLIKIIRDANASRDDQVRAYDQLQTATGGAIEGYSLEEIAAGKADKALADYTDTIKKAREAEVEFANYKGLEEKLEALEENGYKAVDVWTRVRRSILNAIAPGSQGLSLKNWWDTLFDGQAFGEQIVNQEIGKIKDIQSKILKGVNGAAVNDLLNQNKPGSVSPPGNKPSVDQNKKYWEDKKKEAQDELDGLDYIAAKGKEGQALLKKIAEYDKKIEAYSSKKTKSTNDNALKVLKDISDAEFEVHKRTLSQNEQEIAAIKEKYRVLRSEAKKAVLSAGAITRIDNAEKKDIGSTSYEQETKTLKEELEKRKKAYEDYNAVVTKEGEAVAFKMLGHTLTEFESYGALIDSEMAKIESIMESRDLTRPEIDRLIELRKMREEEYLKEAQTENERYLRAYNAAKNHAQKILDIDREYEENRKALIDAGASPAQLEQLKRDRDQRVSDETAANLKIENNWDATFKKMALMSKDAVKKYLDDVEKKYKAELAAGKLTVAQFEALMDEVNDARIDTSNPFENVIKSLEEWRKNVKLFGKDSEEAKTAFKDFAGAVAEAAGKVNQVLGEIANSIQQLGIGDENLDKALANVMGVVDGVGQIGKGIASGNPVDIIAGSIKVLTNAIDLFNQKDRKLQKQIDGYKAQLESLGKAYRQLEKDIANSVGESYYDDSERAIANMEAQIIAIERMRKAEQDKKKTDKGKIAEYDEQILSLKDSIAETQRAISEMLLQTNFKQFSQTLTDVLVSAFEAGEDGIDAMNSAFDDFIKNAIANAVKLRIIEPIINEMMQAATEYAKKNNNSLIGFDFEKYRRDLTTAVALGQQMYNGALKDMGIDREVDKANNQGSLSREISGISETTANRLEAEFGGLRLAQLQLLETANLQTGIMQQYVDFARQNVDAALLIERNTFRTAENTEHLSRLGNIETAIVALNSKITNTDALARGAGIR